MSESTTAAAEATPTPTPVPAPPAPAAATPTPPAGDPPKPNPDDFKSEGSKQAVLADLAKERDARQALEQKFDALAQALGVPKPESGKTDIEELTERLTQHEQSLASEREARWRAEVAHEKNLTAKQAARLVGTTKDELLADADDLLASFPTPDPAQQRRFPGSADAGARKHEMPNIDELIRDAESKGDVMAAIRLKSLKPTNQ